MSQAGWDYRPPLTAPLPFRRKTDETLFSVARWRKILTGVTKRIMTIAIDPEVEAGLRRRAETEGLTIAGYIERLVKADQSAEEEIERLALEGLNSGEPIKPGPGYWEAKHRRLDERLEKTGIA